jgi:hypothetical protein
MPAYDQKRLRYDLELIRQHATAGYDISVEGVRDLIDRIGHAFVFLFKEAGCDSSAVKAIRTKFRDAGRRSAPWKPTSSRVPGRPQDGADGNRITRWLLPEDHKFYASEKDGTLVEVKYYLQALSMENSPRLPEGTIQDSFDWMLEHPVQPGLYIDPIQLIVIDMKDFLRDRKLVQSGHLMPLDRGGKHVPRNAFLMLARSNTIQGNLTVDELISLMEKIVQRHKERGDYTQKAIDRDTSTDKLSG